MAPKRKGLVYRLKPKIIVNESYFVADRLFYYIFGNFDKRADLIFFRCRKFYPFRMWIDLWWRRYKFWLFWNVRNRGVYHHKHRLCIPHLFRKRFLFFYSQKWDSLYVVVPRLPFLTSRSFLKADVERVILRNKLQDLIFFRVLWPRMISSYLGILDYKGFIVQMH